MKFLFFVLFLLAFWSAFSNSEIGVNSSPEVDYEQQQNP